MKTRNALFALCLPLAFAACQNEELVDLGNQGAALKNRGVVDVTISAARPGVGADTRMSSEWAGTSLKFLWEKGNDKLGAAMMDGGAVGTVSGTNVYVNNPFIAQNDGATSEFKSPSSLAKGIYLFYNQYQDVLDRGELKLVMGTQEYDPASAKTAEQQMASYMKMIAPMVDLTKEGITLDGAKSFSLPLKFVNLYTPVKVPVVFKNAPEGTKLTQISLNTPGGFVLGGAVDATTLAGDPTSKGYANVLQLKNGAIDESVVKVDDAIASLGVIVQKSSNGGGIYKNDGSLKRGAAVLDIKGGVELKNGEAKDFWVLIPRDTYTSITVSAETTNGSMAQEVRTIAAPADPDAFNPQIFNDQYRSMKSVEIDFNNNVYQNTSFDIASSADWKTAVEYVMGHVASYIGRTIEFRLVEDKSVYIDELPAFGFTLVGADDAKVVLGDKDGNEKSITADFSGLTMDNDPEIEIAEGATVTLTKDAKTGAFSLTNYGALNMNVTTAASIINYGVTNVNGKGTIGSLVNIGTVNVNADNDLKSLTNNLVINNVDYKGTVNVNSPATLTMGTTAATSNSGNIVIKKGAVLANAQNFTNDAGAYIENSGKLDVANVWTNNGVIKVMDGSVSSGSGISDPEIVGNGEAQVVNPVTYTALNANEGYKFNASVDVTAVVTMRETFNAANTAGMGVTLSGGDWTIKASTTASSNTSRDIAVSEMPTTFKLAANLVDGDANGSNMSTKQIEVTGNVSITSAKEKSLKIGKITVAEGKTLTINSGSKILVPSATTAADNVEVNGTLVNNGVLACEGNATAIAAPANVLKTNILVNAKGSVKNNNVIGGEKNTQVNVTLKGKMDNTGKTLYGTVDLSQNPKEWKYGTQKPFADIVSTATDKAGISAFIGAKSITLNGVVTEIPADCDLTFTGAANITLDNSGKYGNLTFESNATVSASTASTVKKITLKGGVTLTVGDDKDITVNSVTKSGAGNVTISDDSDHLKGAKVETSNPNGLWNLVDLNS